jgi:hypothetical protein
LKGCPPPTIRSGQGDQIGCIFAYWVIVSFWQFFENKKVAHIFGPLYPRLRLCDAFDKKWVGLHLERFFSQNHLVTLVIVHTDTNSIFKRICILHT